MLIHYRSIYAAAWAIIFLVVHLAILALLSLANAGFIMVLERDLRRDMGATPWGFFRSIISGDPATRRWLEDGGTVFLMGFLLVALAAGAWVRGALGHWRWPRPLMAWAVLVSGWVWLESVIWPLTWLDGRLSGTPAKFSGHSIESSGHLLIILCASLLISLGAAPIGRLVSRALAGSRRQRFIKRLNRRRRTRRGE